MEIADGGQAREISMSQARSEAAAMEKDGRNEQMGPVLVAGPICGHGLKWAQVKWACKFSFMSL